MDDVCQGGHPTLSRGARQSPLFLFVSSIGLGLMFDSRQGKIRGICVIGGLEMGEYKAAVYGRL